MKQELTFKEAIDDGRFLEAEEMINRGDDILKSRWRFKLSDAFGKIIENNAFNVLEALVEKGHIEMDIYEYDSFEYTIFQSLAENISDSDEALAFLNNFIPKVENLNDNLGKDTWLGLAFSSCAPAKMIQAMIDNGCNINYVNNVEDNFLHSICYISDYKITPELRAEYIQICVDNGLDINKKDLSGNTPLHEAIRCNRETVAELLLENGADPNIPNKKGETVYLLAIVHKHIWEFAKKMNDLMPIDLEAETGRKTTILFDYVNFIVIQMIFLSKRRKF